MTTWNYSSKVDTAYSLLAGDGYSLLLDGSQSLLVEPATSATWTPIAKTPLGIYYTIWDEVTQSWNADTISWNDHTRNNNWRYNSTSALAFGVLIDGTHLLTLDGSQSLLIEDDKRTTWTVIPRT